MMMSVLLRRTAAGREGTKHRGDNRASTFCFGEPFNASRRTWKEWIGLALFPLGRVIGFAVACWKETLGGAITVGVRHFVLFQEP
jgi:hypothetical protein